MSIFRRTVEKTSSPTPALGSGRLVLRPLETADFPDWRVVRQRSEQWLQPWEPCKVPGAPDVVEDRHAFAARCQARRRERELGMAFAFGVFVNGNFAGEVNLSSVQRGPLQMANIGYWIDVAQAGNAYVPEAVVAVFRFAFDDLGLHRLQISIIPRNEASLSVVRKLGLRNEGLSLRYLEIAGVWEDHLHFAITAEEWALRRAALTRQWLSREP